MNRSTVSLLTLWLFLLLIGCNKNDTTKNTDNDTDSDNGTVPFPFDSSDTDADMDTDTDSDIDSNGDTSVNSDPRVHGLNISAIAIYQSVKIPLMDKGREVTPRNAQVVQGKDALLRIFVERQPEWSPRRVKAVVDFESEIGFNVEPLDTELYVNTDSSDEHLQSTLNIPIPADYLAGDLRYRVSLQEISSNSGMGNADAAEWPADGMASMNEESPGGPLKIVIIPVRYKADGLDRVPDTTAARINSYYNGFYLMYPAAEIEIEVGETLDYEDEILSDGTGFQGLLQAITSLRNTHGATAEKYYYGLVNPADTFVSFCETGLCAAGLSWGNATSSEYPIGDAQFRASIGLGFAVDYTVVTMLHEIGHAHGRLHAPCQSTDDIDNGFPYGDGSIGTWGYDLVADRLKSPHSDDPDGHYDFMGYCPNEWVSDYTYAALFDRIQDVNTTLPYMYLPPEFRQTWFSFSIDIKGNLSLGPTMQFDGLPGGDKRQIEWLDANEQVVDIVTGYFRGYDHLEGGLVLFPKPPIEIIYGRLPGSKPIMLGYDDE